MTLIRINALVTAQVQTGKNLKLLKTILNQQSKPNLGIKDTNRGGTRLGSSYSASRSVSREKGRNRPSLEIIAIWKGKKVKF